MYPDFPLELIQIADTRKPFLQDEMYHFSISHCGDYAAVVVSREYRVGVDIEMITPKVEKIIHKFLSQQEQLLLPTEEKFKMATVFWSVKESVYKWKGLGSVDFIRHINIKSVEDREGEGVVNCIFDSKVPLQLHYLLFNNNCLTWLFTQH